MFEMASVTVKLILIVCLCARTRTLIISLVYYNIFIGIGQTTINGFIYLSAYLHVLCRAYERQEQKQKLFNCKCDFPFAHDSTISVYNIDFFMLFCKTLCVVCTQNYPPRIINWSHKMIVICMCVYVLQSW